MIKIKIFLYKEIRVFIISSVDFCLFIFDWFILVGWFLFILREVKDFILKI